MPRTVPRPEQVATLSFNGTDTYYQPIGYIPKFPVGSANPVSNRSETISFLASCMQAGEKMVDISEYQQDIPALVTNTLQAKQGEKRPLANLATPLSTKLIEGPDTSGSLVFSKVAEGTASLLGSILEGRTVLNIQGHSRGAIESILVAHELNRIKTALSRADDGTDAATLLSYICDSPDDKIKQMLTRLLSPMAQHPQLISELQKRFKLTEEETTIRVNLCLLDPVPGNTVKSIPGITWYDPRYFSLPPIVEHARVVICENEDSACFDCVIPAAEDPSVTKVTRRNIPGHHGTLTGNPFGNNGEPLSQLGVSEGTAEHAQIITIYENYDFLSAHGTVFIETSSLDCPLADRYNKYAGASPQGRAELRLLAYEAIKANQHAYKALNRTAYVLGFHEAFEFPHENAPNIRPVLTGLPHYTSNLGIQLPFSSKYFVNESHVRLFLTHRVGLPLDEEKPRYEQLQELLQALDNSDRSADLNHKLREPLTLQLAEEGIKRLVSELVQSYLQNGLVPQVKAKILDRINRSLSLPAEVVEEVSAGQQLTPVDRLKRNYKEHLSGYLLDQVEQQVQAHHDDLERLVRSMHRSVRVPEDEISSTVFFFDAHAKYQQFKAFEDHLTDLSKRIPGGSQLHEDLPQKIRTLRDYRTIIAVFCAKTMVEKDLSMQTILSSGSIPILSEFHDETVQHFNGVSGLIPTLQEHIQNLEQQNAQYQRAIDEQAETSRLRGETIRQRDEAINGYLGTIRAHEETIEQQNATIGNYQQTLRDGYNNCQLLGLNGISLQVVSGFIAVIGIAAVLLALAVLAANIVAGSSLVAAGVALKLGLGAAVVGSGLSAVGLFGMSRGAQGQDYQEKHNTTFPAAVPL